MDTSFVTIPAVTVCQATGSVRLSAHSRRKVAALVGQQSVDVPTDVLELSVTPSTVSVPRLVVTV